MEASVLILAGGRSKRFGEDKLIFRLNGKPLISYPVSEAKKVSNNVYIITSDDELRRIKSVVDGIEFLVDDLSLRCEGPARGIVTGLKDIDSDYYIVIPGDSPWINEVALNNLLNFSIRNGEIVAPLIAPGIVSPLFMTIPKKSKGFIIDICNSLSAFASRPSNFLRGCKTFIVGTYYLTDKYSTFCDIDRKIDLYNTIRKGLTRRFVTLDAYKFFIEAVKAYKQGLLDRAYSYLVSESKFYRRNRIYSLELSALTDMLLVSKKEERARIESRIRELRKFTGRMPKEYEFFPGIVPLRSQELL